MNRKPLLTLAALCIGLSAPQPTLAQKTLLAVFAHPDDERIVAPLLARYAREGHNVYLVVATDGAKGVTPHAGIPAGDSLAAVRVRETQCAASALGIKPPIMLAHPDAGLASFAALDKLRADLVRVIGELKPDAIVTFGREGGTGHPDHRLVGDVVTEIVQALPNSIPLYYPGLPAERMADAPPARPQVRQVAERYLNVRVSYTPEDFDKAVRSYICHKSQYTEEQARANMRYVQHGFQGAVHLRAWNGGEPRTDLFVQTARIMTYNIFAGHDLERRPNLERVAALIDSLRADVVLLQEVDRLTARSGRVDQAALLARLTGMRFVFGRAMDYDGGEYGIAVLSRFPVLSSRVVPLLVPALTDSAVRAAEPRALLHVVLTTPGGELHIVDTHLDQQAHGVARNAQVLQLLAYTNDIPKNAPLVLGGDMNARPDGFEVRALAAALNDAWSSCGTGPGLTFRSDSPDRRIDYLLLARVRCTSAQVIATQHSDHRPLVIDVQVPN